LHRLGVHVREIHVPSRGFAFYVRQGELRVFRPEARRFRLPGTKLIVRAPDGSSIEVPWMQVPGCETRHVGATRIRAADADRLVSLLEGGAEQAMECAHVVDHPLPLRPSIRI